MDRVTTFISILQRMDGPIKIFEDFVTEIDDKVFS